MLVTGAHWFEAFEANRRIDPYALKAPWTVLTRGPEFGEKLPPMWGVRITDAIGSR